LAIEAFDAASSAANCDSIFIISTVDKKEALSSPEKVWAKIGLLTFKLKATNNINPRSTNLK
jgi:hypothetical protein